MSLISDSLVLYKSVRLQVLCWLSGYICAKLIEYVQNMNKYRIQNYIVLNIDRIELVHALGVIVKIVTEFNIVKSCT